MRTLLLLFCFTVLAACGPPAYVEVGPAYPPSYPSYVNTYPGGGCWADDVWYPRCPWYAGPSYGYYWYGSGGYVHRPGYVWRDHRSPPPRTWRPPPSYRPPTVRDHRDDPRVRDHRRPHR